MDLARDINKAYQELDLTPGASLDEVKEAYRRLARALHPDLHPGAMGALMSRVNQAYEKLVRHLEGQYAHQAGPAKSDNRQEPTPSRPQGQKSARHDGFKTYEYEEFTTERSAHGEHARRYSAWQELKRRFYEQAKQAAEAAAQDDMNNPAKEMTWAEDESHADSFNVSESSGVEDEGQVVSPSDPRPAGSSVMGQEEKPAAGPVGLDLRGDQGWRLLGLEKRDDVLLYRVELSGQPGQIDLPVRCCRSCQRCGGTGRHRDAKGQLRRCPACGGRGRIARADRVQVELPRDWHSGQIIRVQACNSETEILVQLVPARV